MPRLLSLATIGAVSLGAAFGLTPAASADPPPARRVSVAVDIIGDSYMAGDGVRDTYLDPADPRHRSAGAPALQALSRLQSANTRLLVDANVVAASGAQTTDFFEAQKGPGDTVVNPPQRDQVRPGAQLVLVGFGGDDAHLATVIADVERAANGLNVALDKEIRDLGPLLDWTSTDQEYLAQAKSSAPGRAPTLVARLLQVLAGIRTRAPHATIVLTNYPLATDPRNPHAASAVGESDLTSVRKFGYDLNKAIERAARICHCASLVDLAAAVAGHEAYTADSAFDEQPGQEAAREQFRPNRTGASLIADPIAAGIARLLWITPPKPGDGKLTDPSNITVHNGVSDRDGDRVPDSGDRRPDDPARSVDAPKPRHGGPSPHKVSNVGRHPVKVVRRPAGGTAEPAPAASEQPVATGNDSVVPMRKLLAHGDKRPRPGGTTPVTLTRSAVPPKRENHLTPAAPDKHATGAESSERKPDPADAGTHLTRTAPNLSRAAQGTPRLRGLLARQRAAAESPEPKG
ncbi:GDSL-type esterase/lipase family protein [Amycolatopsis sp. NBRC 101858]|uniref:GDSL-type esterase/lipase family protein n=1 Tax=Amycolatopsis sp. NBRC 101858 TaxID=3032200 RepID=UPI00255243FB|nr:GDSL-type esterase/lipase family protein [Amycolatopsis sp. NBRC 101858]